MKLSGKIALVTGAGRGIGKGCAIALAEAGADILLNDRPGSPDIHSSAEEIRALGRRCWPLEADIFERGGCESLVTTALAEAGRIDILVSNPAFSRRDDFLDFDAALFDRTLQGALASGFHMSQLVARHFVARGGGGKILFISSVHGELPFPRTVAYNAAKAGLDHMMRSIAGELIGHRVNVNSIAPGWIDTPGEHETFSDETMAGAGKEIPWGRLGLPADIGKAALFLCSDDADYITGEILTVDGGIRLKGCLDHQSPPAP
ncbi:MAG: SDR family oxidoreductase [Verrucomicrobiaceae bacterium]|nr:SDR family oxidoreductase [Verrucomicrobiaceae bacterium]